MELFESVTGERLRKSLLVASIVLAVFLGVSAISEILGWRYIGGGVVATNTITVSGHGEVLQTPDVALFTFTVTSTKDTVAAAQEDATQKANAATAYLKSAGVEEKDIKTIDYSVYPHYEYQQITCIAYPCSPGRQVLMGYDVRQSTQVKVRDTKKAGDLLAGVGSKGATEVSGLTFTFDDPTGVQDEARAKAIAEAKEKAELLAKQLGVSLVRVVSFNEGGNTPAPMYRLDAAMGMGGATKSSAPEISLGQNKVTDDISITYEIR